MTVSGPTAPLLAAHRRASCADGLAQVLGILVESARELLGATGAVLAVWEPLSRDVRCAAASGCPADAAAGLARAAAGVLDAEDSAEARVLSRGSHALVDQVLEVLDGTALHVVPLHDARGDDVGVLLASVPEESEAGQAVQELRATAEAEVARALRGESLQRRALYDAATGLAGSVLLEAALADALSGAGDTEQVAVVLTTVDQLHAVARSFGRVVADELARKVAARLLVTAAGQHGMVARLPQGFAVLVRGAPGTAEAVAASVVAALQEPWVVGRRSVRSTCRTGVAVAGPGATPVLLVEQAEAALAEASRRPGGGWASYGAGLTATAHEQLVLETLLQAALADDQLHLRYQPQVDIGTGRVTGAEALVRWHRPHGGVVPPDRFIPAAEATGVILDIDRWVMRTAFAQARLWADGGLPALRMAVNVSSRTLAAPGFSDTVVDAVATAGLDPSLVEVEVTESLELLESAHAVAELVSLRELGMHVALDDFGTGYSNVGRLRSLPVDRVKIDQSFVRDISADGDGEALCSAVIGLARTLDLDVIAEGVETVEQLAVLRSRGCAEFQGYLKSPPVPAAAFAELVG